MPPGEDHKHERYAGNEMTDSELILRYLQRFPGWQNSVDMSRTLKPGAVNWALRSRISCDLNNRILPPLGLKIESRLGENGMADYKLVKIEPQSEK